MTTDQSNLTDPSSTAAVPVAGDGTRAADRPAAAESTAAGAAESTAAEKVDSAADQPPGEPDPAERTGPDPAEQTGADSGARTPDAGGQDVEEPGGERAGSGQPASAETGRPEAEKSTDKWAAFGPAPERVPGRARKLARAVGRRLVHEWTLASLAGLVLAVLMTWPTLQYPQYTIAQDIWDPTLQAWQMAWSGHILLTDPTQLWNSNTFYPERWSFAFSDSLLGYAPAGMIGSGPVAAVLRYNIMFVLAHALATVGAYALLRQLGAGRIGAAVAGVAYTYAPWLLAQSGHLHVISNGGIPLALAMLARGHGWSMRHGYRPERRNAGWALAGWFVAAWQISLGFGIGLPFAYILGLILLVAVVTWYVRWIRFRAARRSFGVRLLAADLAGAALFAATGALLSIPYFKVAQLHPNAKRSVGDLAINSPPLRGLFTAPAESAIWGQLHAQARAALPWPPEMTLLPGFVLYALAAGGLVFSIWTVRQRLLLLAGVLITGVLALGTQFFGGTFTYLPLFEYLPGWNGLRTPGRLMLWTTLLLGILAAGAVSAYAARVREVSAERVPPRPGPWLRLVTLLPLVLVLVEGLNVTPHPIVPAQPAALRTVEGPILVLPSDQLTDENVMLWSTTRFQAIVNGGSGFTPDRLAEVRRVTVNFPDQTSIDYLRSLGVRTVVLLRNRVAGTQWQNAINLPVNGLGIQREELGDTVVYHL
jgi:hypothetical protein